MAHKSQHKQKGPYPTRDHYPAQRSSSTSHEVADKISKAKEIEELVKPVFSFPFTDTYASELEISGFEDIVVTIPETMTQATSEDWDPATCVGNRTFVEELFDDVREVAFDSASRQ